MEPETCQKLTPGIYDKYGNRKRNGRISLFIDTNTETAYLVPKEEEHIDFAKRLVQQDYSRLVPVHIDTEMRDTKHRIVGMIIGVSGLEVRLGVRHDIEDLKKAHDVAWKLVNSSDIPVGKIREDRIIMRYAKNSKKYTE